MFGNYVKRIVQQTIQQLTMDTETKFEAMHKKFRTIESLEQEISKLKIEKSVKEEEFARHERDVTHKLGLERMRQEQDAEASKKLMQLEVREQNLSAEEKRFKDQLKFEREHLQDQIKNLNVLVEKVFEKLPQVSHEYKTIERRASNAIEPVS